MVNCLDVSSSDPGCGHPVRRRLKESAIVARGEQTNKNPEDAATRSGFVVPVVATTVPRQRHVHIRQSANLGNSQALVGGAGADLDIAGQLTALFDHDLAVTNLA